jgi:cobalamin-dependent methionine synthase I
MKMNHLLPGGKIIMKPLPKYPVASHHMEKMEKNQELLLVGGGLHILNPHVHRAIRKQNASLLTSMAQKEVDAGAGALSINLGPGRDIAGLTPWIVDTLSGGVDVPLFLSAGVLTMDRLLEKHSSRITVNAITADPKSLPDHLAIAKKHALDLVVLLVRPGLVPSGIEDRLQLACEVVDTAMRIGLPPGRLYLDPVISCRPDPVAWKISRGFPDIGTVIETISFINDLDQGVRTIAALHNGTSGMETAKRTAAHRSMLSLLAEAGLDAVILNCFDSDLIKTAQGVKSVIMPLPENRAVTFSATA